MNVEPWRHEFDVAVRAVREGARLARGIRQRMSGPAFLKADRSPVTVADFAVQALVAHRLRQAFPDDPVVAEEDSAPLRTAEGRAILQSVVNALQSVAPELASATDPPPVFDAIDRGAGTPGERFWTLDPIDGTQGFVRGDQYVVALALIVRGRVALGILGCPGMALTVEGTGADRPGAVLAAVRGRGAYRSSLTADAWVPVRVSSCADPRKARVLRSVEGEHIDLDTFNRVMFAMNVEASPILMDSQAKHAVIAAGLADLMIRTPATRAFRDKIWDQAAGSIVVEEAGGRVSDLRGRDLDFGTGRSLSRNEGVVVSNGHLHEAVLAAIRADQGPHPTAHLNA